MSNVTFARPSVNALTLVIIFPVTSTVTGGDEIPLTVALYRVLRSGVTVNENDPSAAVVVPATAVTAVKGYGLAYSSTDEPASAPDGALPNSVAGCPLATVAGRTVKLVADVPEDWYEAASAPVGTANNPATTIAATILASIRELYGSNTKAMISRRSWAAVITSSMTRSSDASESGALSPTGSGVRIPRAAQARADSAAALIARKIVDRAPAR